MRLDGSKWQQLVLVCITIICALVLGYITAQLTGNNAATGRNTPLPEANADLLETAVSEVPAASLTATVEPELTATTAPSATPTSPSPSAGPSPSPTREVAQQPDLFVVESFDSATNSFLTRETDTWSAGVVDGQYQLKLNGQQNIGFTTPLPAENYRLGFDLTVPQGGAGMVFLVAEPSTTYRLLITSDGAYSLERQDATEAAQIVSWTESAALRQGADSVNRLLIERQGNRMRFLANDELLTEYEIPTGTFENRYGFVLTSRNGQGQALFDNLRGERLPNS